MKRCVVGVLLALSWVGAARAEQPVPQPGFSDAVPQVDLRSPILLRDRAVSAHLDDVRKGRKIAVASDLVIAFLFASAQLGFQQTNPALSELPFTAATFAVVAGTTVLEDLLVDQVPSVAWFDCIGFLTGLLAGAAAWGLAEITNPFTDQGIAVGVIMGTGLVIRLGLGLIPDPQGIGPKTWLICMGALAVNLVMIVLGAVANSGPAMAIGAFGSAATMVLGRVIDAVTHPPPAIDSTGAVTVTPSNDAPKPPPFTIWAGPLDKGRTTTVPVATGLALRF